MGNTQRTEYEKNLIVEAKIKSGTAGFKLNYNFNRNTKILGEGGFGKVFLTNHKKNTD